MRTFCHNDLGAEHLLATPDAGVVTGVIDWSDAAIGDPARDLGLILRDLGPTAAAGVVSHVGARDPDHLLERARFYARCGLLEDLAYGRRTGDRRYSEHALARMSETFGVR